MVSTPWQKSLKLILPCEWGSKHLANFFTWLITDKKNILSVITVISYIRIVSHTDYWVYSVHSIATRFIRYCLSNPSSATWLLCSIICVCPCCSVPPTCHMLHQSVSQMERQLSQYEPVITSWLTITFSIAPRLFAGLNSTIVLCAALAISVQWYFGSHYIPSCCIYPTSSLVVQ